jgi:uncharacterized protein YPO0396
MDNLSLTAVGVRPGFRLHKLEVYNWGTFDSTTGQVHTVRPSGATTLLIGQNGSGKSTLVDALLTLLVKPGGRNYNVAAGARKQERDERSYIRGACGRRSRDEDNHPDIQFLRSANGHYSALLACFRNEGTDEAFTLAQILYLNAEGRSEKVYCFAPAERSIVDNCGGLTSMERLRQQMEKRGFRATTSFSEYQKWFEKATGVRSKAMDVFNQTVAVKDIQSLNRFIRDHMLEAKPWNDRVEGLLNHFTQLSDAHRSLVLVRKQFESLTPIVEAGGAYRRQAGQLEEVRRLVDASDSFFCQKLVDLYTPECESRQRGLDAVREKKKLLDRQIAEVQEECRRLKNEIEQAGGERLRQIPLLIQNHETQAGTKREAHRQYHEALRAAGIVDTVGDATAFTAVQKQLAPVVADLETEIHQAENRRNTLVIQQDRITERVQEDEAEYQALSRRQGNLPEYLARLRHQLCEGLHLPEKDLPFVAELIAVKPDERGWESSIEMVLRSFALSLLVPTKYYQLVSGYVDRTRLADVKGRGQRLVYLRVGERKASPVIPVGHRQSLLRKLAFREGHSLIPWVRGELEERFDFRCCDTLAEFQDAQGLAVTQHRHVKMRGLRHEKDDREHVSDPRNYVLGWDNREKCRRLAEGIARLRQECEAVDRQIGLVEKELTGLRDRMAALRNAQKFTDFPRLDYAPHEKEIKALRREQKELEENNVAVRLLKSRLGEAESRHKAFQASRDEAVCTERQLEHEIEDGQRAITSAQSQIRRDKANGTFERHAKSFSRLEACFADAPLTAATLVERSQAFIKARNAELERLHQEIEPVKDALLKLMARFVHEYREVRVDLDADVEYLDSFLDLQDRIRREDLPRHEQRFKERLNEKVIQEIGLLNGALQTERREILDKIDLLNISLRQLEYCPGTHMRLDPRQARDSEIAEFQDSLKQCLAGTFEGTLEADEARYLRIEKLLTRLREDPHWRDRVTDVRRWFDFGAQEVDNATGDERGYYQESTGQSGGEKAKLAFTILVAAIAYQYDIDPERATSERFHFVVVDEMFSKVDDQYSEYALELFEKFGLQLLIVAPLDAKARVTEPYVGCYLHVVKAPLTNQSELFSMTAREFEAAVLDEGHSARLAQTKPR